MTATKVTFKIDNAIDELIIEAAAQTVHYKKSVALDFFNTHLNTSYTSIYEVLEGVDTDELLELLLNSSTDFKEMRCESVITKMSLNSDFGTAESGWKWQSKIIELENGHKGKCTLSNGAFTEGHRNFKLSVGCTICYSLTYIYQRDFTLRGLANPKRLYTIRLRSRLNSKTKSFNPNPKHKRLKYNGNTLAA